MKDFSLFCDRVNEIRSQSYKMSFGEKKTFFGVNYANFSTHEFGRRILQQNLHQKMSLVVILSLEKRFIVLK
jgi:hypothetical protein